jgi:hypothetical protein
MQSGGQSVRPIVRHRPAKFLTTILGLAIAFSLPAAAQVYSHPPTTTTIGGHNLAPAPSVTSVGNMHMPPPAPSVTSLPNYGYNYRGGSYGYGHHGRYGYTGGWAYAVPYYYYPADASAYGYDYVGGGGGGPDLYSGPPPSANDPTLHIVVEQPPSNPYATAVPPMEERPEPVAKPLPDDKPGDPTVLVFRSGHQQEVNSYAIMGDSIYIFDQGRKKIALADLNIPATVKANDARGVEFRLPDSQKNKPAMTITVPADSGSDSAPKSTAGMVSSASALP